MILKAIKINCDFFLCILNGKTNAREKDIETQMKQLRFICETVFKVKTIS